MQFRTINRAANALPSALLQSVKRPNKHNVHINSVSRTTVIASILHSHSISHLECPTETALFPQEPPLQPYVAKPANVGSKSHHWLMNRRPAPYVVIYNALKRYYPSAATFYHDPADEDVLLRKALREGRAPADPDVDQAAILQLLPTIGSIIAKLMAWQSHSIHRTEEDVSHEALSALIFNKSERKYMARKGIVIEDIEDWIAILIEPDTEASVARLNSHMFVKSCERTNTYARMVPVPVITMVLRRVGITSRALQILLTCSWHIMRFLPHEQDRVHQVYKLSIRLIEAAQTVWADCIPNIASFLITFLSQSNQGLQPQRTSNERRRHELTEIFNMGIQYLRYSRGPHPYRNSIYLEKAQFMILSHMVLYDPPLHVEGETFFALVTVQLKRSKTSQEEQWAALQSRGWPPYPKPRTAMDEDKGFQYGASRAMRTLQHMRQAGYAYPEWANVAQIYAGWDVDMTPTIQTRLAHLSRNIDFNHMKNEHAVWAAKIDTTRDVREAWAIFLHFESTMLPGSTMIFYAMARKIEEERRRNVNLSLLNSQHQHVSPGDAKEVIAPATSPAQKVFVAAEPPTIMDFVDRIFKSEMKLAPWFIGYLMSASPTIDDGLSIWSRSQTGCNVENIFSAATKGLDGEENMSDVEIRGFVTLLCNHPTHNSWPESLIIPDAIQASDSLAITLAARLVIYRRIRHALIYETVVAGMIRTLYAAPIALRSQRSFHLFKLLCQMLIVMRENAISIEDGFFVKLTHFLEIFGRANHNMIGREGYHSTSLRTASTILRQTFSFLTRSSVDKPAMNAATEGTDAENWIPRATHTPHPVNCQHYIRALATYGDHEGLYSFARWLAANEADMVASLANVTRGSQRWAVVITAFRVALECPHRMFPGSSPGTIRRASEELVELVKITLESMSELGGWASDSQVEDYAKFVELNAKITMINRLAGRYGC